MSAYYLTRQAGVQLLTTHRVAHQVITT